MTHSLQQEEEGGRGELLALPCPPFCAAESMRCAVRGQSGAEFISRGRGGCMFNQIMEGVNWPGTHTSKGAEY